MIQCPYCQHADRQVKAGLNHGVQRYKCAFCRRRYTPESRSRGYSEEIHHKALQMFAEGIKIREISRQLGVNHQTVSNWIHPSTEKNDTEKKDTEKKDTEKKDTEEKEAPLDPILRSPTKTVASDNRRPTIDDVARLASVSISTVSNFLNDKGRMSAVTRDRIKAAMAELHFTPSALTRAIRQRRTHILGAVIFGVTHFDENVGGAISIPILAGINATAYDRAHHILLYTGLRHHSPELIGLEFLDGHVDGLIWVAPAVREPALERVATAGLPIVALLSRHVPDGVGYVNADNVAAMRVIVEYLVTLGHCRIAFAGSIYGFELNSNFLDRREGYRQGLAAVGLPYDSALDTADTAMLLTMEDYSQTLDRWLALSLPPTAIITQNDGSALWMIQTIRKRGLRVPEDIAVTGFDDIPDARHLEGGLTTIKQPFRQAGNLAVERLIAMIEGASIDECRVTVPTQLIVRASTGRHIARKEL